MLMMTFLIHSWFVYDPIGRTHLACVKYAGPKAISNRKPLCHEMTVRDDVNLLSFYAKNRLAALGLALESVTGISSIEKSWFKSFYFVQFSFCHWSWNAASELCIKPWNFSLWQNAFLISFLNRSHFFYLIY